MAQWATGNIGSRALRHIIEHPTMELVGVHVYGADKVGKDAGELAGVDPTGVLATDSIEAIIGARPDCVIYSPRRTEVDVLCELLAAGINVVSTGGDVPQPGEHGRRSAANRSRPPAGPATRRSTAPAAALVSSPRPCRSRCCRSNGGSTG